MQNYTSYSNLLLGSNSSTSASSSVDNRNIERSKVSISTNPDTEMDSLNSQSPCNIRNKDLMRSKITASLSALQKELKSHNQIVLEKLEQIENSKKTEVYGIKREVYELDADVKERINTALAYLNDPKNKAPFIIIEEELTYGDLDSMPLASAELGRIHGR